MPEKEFKAVVHGERIRAVGNALAAQPLYKLLKDDFGVWLYEIVRFCESDSRKCYAENAFNKVSDRCATYPLDVRNELCAEIDTPEDLSMISNRL